MGKRIAKRAGIALLIIAGLLGLLLLLSWVNHRIQLAREEAIYQPMGKQVAVNGHSMNVYTEGNGEVTLVFLSGSGTCSPVLDFKSLYSLLSSRYRIAVVERAGYGFSEDTNLSRDLDTVLSETRQALSAAGLSAPYIVCPHSMSGIEALYWAQQYPEEVTAIIGLDMAVPEAYGEMEINLFAMQLSSFAARVGLTRWIPGLAESDAIRHGTLTQEEKDLYRAVFYRSTLTTAMRNETKEIKASAETVANGGPVDVPLLMFASDGSGGTGFDEQTWRGFQHNFAAVLPNAQVVELDCPHYVHDYQYEEISEEMMGFIGELP